MYLVENCTNNEIEEYEFLEDFLDNCILNDEYMENLVEELFYQAKKLLPIWLVRRGFCFFQAIKMTYPPIFYEIYDEEKETLIECIEDEINQYGTSECNGYIIVEDKKFLESEH